MERSASDRAPDIAALAERVEGELLLPPDEGFDGARAVWNARIDRRPAAVLRCAGPHDVVAGVRFAREENVPLSVKGGGHSYAGSAACDRCLLIDLEPMSDVRVDPDERTARVGAGATWKAVDRETQAAGLATTGASVSTVGVAGYTLGGGTGHLARSCGLAVDNLVSAEVVTADGGLVRASENENADLFWALRGGGGNFGVVTSFELVLHEVGPEILAGMIVHPFRDAPELLRGFRALMADAPDELNCYPFFIRVPPAPAFPEAYHGEIALALVPAHSGPLDDAEDALRPLRDLGEPIFDGVAPQPYAALQRTFDDGVPRGQRWYSRAHYLDGLTDDAIDAMVESVEPFPGPFTMAYLEPMGGAIGRVGAEETAFPHREALYGFHVLAGWTDPEADDEHMAWVRSFHEAMAPFSTGGVYVNLVSEDEHDRVRGAYGDNHERLAEVKARWDPENLFRAHPPIEPAP